MVNSTILVIQNIAKSELGWQQFAALMVARFQLHVCHIIVINRNNMTIRYHIDEGVKIPDELGREYLKIVQNDQIMMMVLQQPPIDQFLAVSQLPEDAYDYYMNSEFYTKWSKPQGLLDSATLCLNEDEEWLTLMMCNRNEQIGNFTSHELAEMNTLIPHLREAASLTFSYQADHLLSSRFASLLETFRIPVAILSERGQLCAMNQGMRQLLFEQREIQIINNCFTLSQKRKNQDLYSNLIQANKRLEVGEDYTLVEQDNVDLDSKVTIGFQPLETRLLDGQKRLNGVMVYAIAPQLIAPASVEKLIELFGFTEREAVICQKLAMGKPVKRIALEENISDNTVKYHVKQIFEKTSCHDKVTLTSMINTIPSSR